MNSKSDLDLRPLLSKEQWVIYGEVLTKTAELTHRYSLESCPKCANIEV